MKDMPWDHGLRVTADADGLAGLAGAVLLRKLADRVGLTAALGSALARAGKFPLVKAPSRLHGPPAPGRPAWRWRTSRRCGPAC